MFIKYKNDHQSALNVLSNEIKVKSDDVLTAMIEINYKIKNHDEC